MQRIEKTIDCGVPCRVAYNQWTQFEAFPSFMEGIEQVEQLDDKRLHWVAEIGGRRKEWDAEIIEQVPDQVVSWRSTTGTLNNGSVTFRRVDDTHCQVTLILTYEPQGGLEKVGDALGVVASRVQGDLDRFKEFIESRRVETGAWRGEIREGQVERRSAGARTHAGSARISERERGF